MLKNYKRGSIFFKTLTFSLIPIFIVSSFAVILQIFQMEYIKERKIVSSTEMFENSMRRIEEDIEEVVNSFEILQSDDNIKQLMFWDDKNRQISIFQKYEIRRTLTKTKNIYDFVDNIAIVSCLSGLVIDTSRECSVDVFFNEQRKYDRYDMDFWKSVHENKGFYTFLPPVTVEAGERTETVFPLIISCMNGIKTKSYIIVDIKSDYVYKTVTRNGNANNEPVWVVIGDAVYDVTTGEEITGTKLLKKLNDKNVFTYTENSTKYIGFQYKNKISYLGSHKFVILTPKYVFMKDIYSNMYLMFFFIILIVIINVLLCYFFNKKLYRPIESIKKVLEESNYTHDHFENEFDLIEKSFSKMNFENVLLKNDAQKVISVSKEQYLIKNLEYAETDNEQAIEKIFKESNIVFEQDYYIVAHIEVNYSKAFFEKFNSEQYMHICDGIYSFFYSEFNNKDSVVLSKNNEAFIIIFNTKKENSQIVFEKIHEIDNAFKFDAELVKLLIGLGQMYKGFYGIQKSYIEANRAYSMLHTMPYKSILQYNVSEGQSVGFKYSLEQENKLINYIIGANLTEAMHVVEEIALRNYEYGGDLPVKKAYSQIMQTVLRAADMKRLDYSMFMSDNEINPDKAYDMLQTEEFVEYVNKLLRQVTSFKEQKDGTADIREIIEYINGHCSEELYLDNVAEHFNISPKYLSKMIKSKLGVGFSQYVSMIKIEKAKKLLINTDYRMSDIMNMTGFTSKTTFLRVFKKLEGVTPSEYREMLKSFEKKETDQ